MPARTARQARPRFPPLDLRRAQKRDDLPGELETKARPSDDAPRPRGLPSKGSSSTRPASHERPAAQPLGHEAVVALAGDRGLVCSGTLIAPKVVLTARHCLPVREIRFGVDPRAPFAVSKVKASRTPPLAVLDLALLELVTPSKVTPMHLRATTDATPPTDVVRLVGFGSTDPEGERGMTLRHVVDVQSRGWSCGAVDENRVGCVSGLEMVIPRQGGNDTGGGDSGAPVLESFEGGLRDMSVTSRQVRGSLIACGDGGVYTRVDAAGVWIQQMIREMGKTP